MDITIKIESHELDEPLEFQVRMTGSTPSRSRNLGLNMVSIAAARAVRLIKDQGLQAVEPAWKELQETYDSYLNRKPSL